MPHKKALLSEDLPILYNGNQFKINIHLCLQKQMGLIENSQVVLRVFKSNAGCHILISHLDDKTILRHRGNIVPIIAYGSSKILKGFSMNLPFNIRYAVKGITIWTIFQAELFEGESGFKYLILTVKKEEKDNVPVKTKRRLNDYRLTNYKRTKKPAKSTKRKKKAKKINPKIFRLSKLYNLFIPEKTRQLLGWPTGEWKLIRVIANAATDKRKILVEPYDDSHDYYEPKSKENVALGYWRKLRANRLLDLSQETRKLAEEYCLKKCSVRTRGTKKYLLIT